MGRELGNYSESAPSGHNNKHMIIKLISYVAGGLCAFFVSSLFGASLDVRNFCIWVLLAPGVAISIYLLCGRMKKEIKEEIKREIKEEEGE